ncbi:helix-turn-helix domain-containing protein [Streptomyces sp. C10-9-1]|uniref:helix-turn-helix domain-containing protein n=1 Tax=Streptomyces sp. C10-9-1 TaxID=1859285 RepID=UPI003D758E71
MRERAGLSLTAAATLHGVDKTTISNSESARFGVSPDRVRVWAANFACPEPAYVDALAAMAGERGSHWWDEYRGALSAPVIDIAELEHHAVALRSSLILHLPGLLQEPDYMRAVFEEAVPALSPELLDRNIEFRRARQRILDAPAGPPCDFLVHESALRVAFGGRQVMARQLAYLLKGSERENVRVRVIPFAAGGIPNAGSSAVYAEGPVPALDTVQIDVPHGTIFCHAEADLVRYRHVLGRVEQRSLDPGASQDFIRAVLREM